MRGKGMLYIDLTVLNLNIFYIFTDEISKVIDYAWEIFTENHMGNPRYEASTHRNFHARNKKRIMKSKMLRG